MVSAKVVCFKALNFLNIHWSLVKAICAWQEVLIPEGVISKMMLSMLLLWIMK